MIIRYVNVLCIPITKFPGLSGDDAVATVEVAHIIVAHIIVVRKKNLNKVKRI